MDLVRMDNFRVRIAAWFTELYLYLEVTEGRCRWRHIWKKTFPSYEHIFVQLEVFVTYLCLFCGN